MIIFVSSPEWLPANFNKGVAVRLERNGFIFSRPVSSVRILKARFYVALRRIAAVIVILFFFAYVMKNQQTFNWLNALSILGFWILSGCACLSMWGLFMMYIAGNWKRFIFSFIAFFIIYETIGKPIISRAFEGEVWVIVLLLLVEVSCIILMLSQSLRLFEHARHSVE